MVSERAREQAAETISGHKEAWTGRMRGNVEGGPCSLCGADEYAVREETAECIVEAYETVCRWGYKIEARVLVVEIPHFCGTEVNVHLLDAQCDKHGEDVQFSAREVRREAEPEDQKEMIEGWSAKPFPSKFSTLTAHHLEFHQMGPVDSG